MRASHLFILLSCLALFVCCKQHGKVTAPQVDQDNSQALMASMEDRIGFPDFGFMVQPDDTIPISRVFKLSDDFPRKEPVIDEGVKNILAIDFKSDWRAYMDEVKKYVFEGNASEDYENSFYLEDNKVRPWYHVPWQHWGPNGREGYHGLTQEGPVDDKMLAPTQISETHAYAVGFYNDLGGYAIGKVWNKPEPNYSFFEFDGFPEGTVVAKVLFVPLEADEVPYLKNPVSWDAYIYASDIPGNNSTSKNRITSKVNLIQMDIMVKDKRAIDTGGWVFGTFAYNGNLENDNRWDNLTPVGIMWGNDPDHNKTSYNPTPTKTIINPDLKQTIINDNPEELPPMHLGFASRLNGPVDNAYSSCMSCHSTAQYPVVSAIMPFLNNQKVAIPEAGTNASAQWMRWFRNVPCETPFDPKKATSFDYSLQLVKSIQNYIDYASQAEKGHYSEEYWSKGHKIRRSSIVSD
ncbi:hypothetical protein ACFQ1M_09235 [Sungkyunkwania multivorans]|uniref:Cytochrome c domain-containing protein n=1 Tax=Sungkyunkwania multivorans TaxID=1173618 RepID=A0ABW3CX80_9FLAO